MLLQHGDHTADGKMPVGIWTDMDEDDTGLRLKGKLAVNTERGADAYALLKMKPRPALPSRDFVLLMAGNYSRPCDVAQCH
jgi:hypothetical protein